MVCRVSLYFICFSYFCSLSIPLSAQQKEMESRVYTMNDGLPENAVNEIMEDRLGFIWIATASGLARFDGMSFKNFRNNPISRNSLRSNLVETVVEDTNGNLWIGHSEGVDLFDPKTEQFYFHWPDSSRKPDDIDILKI